MKSSNEGDAARSIAKRIFVEYLERRELDSSYSAERLLAENPAIATELTKLLAEDASVRKIIADDRPTKRTSRIDDHFRSSVDPGIALESETEQIESGSPTSERLQKLSARGIDLRRYLVTDYIDEGGQGTVHKAWDGDLRRNVAIKFLNNVDIESTRSGLPRDLQNRVSRFLEEAQITAQLQHPGIPPVHELGIDNTGKLYFSMKFIRGESLARVIDRFHQKDPQWTLPRLIRIVIKVCETIAFAHARKVIHRDLKPHNIMVGKYGEAYVMDWGLARIEGRGRAETQQTPASKPVEAVSVINSDRSEEASKGASSPVNTMKEDVIGTPPYMSPEAASGDKERIDYRSDIYAIGTILYHIIAGHPPYLPKGSRKTSWVVLENVIEGPPTPIQSIAADIPSELQSIIEHAMNRNPSNRYASIEALNSDLQAFLDDGLVKAYPTNPLLQLRKLLRRNPTASFIALALLFTIIASVSAIAIQQSQRVAAESERAGAIEAKLAAELELSDLQTFAILGGRFDTAWPATPARLPELRALEAEVEELLSHRARHEAELASLSQWEARNEPTNAQDKEATAKRISALNAIVGRAVEFTERVLPSLRARIALAEQGRLRAEAEANDTSISGRSVAWNRVNEELRADPRFVDVQMEPTSLLVPLRRNPETGLQEFWHPQTGSEPTVDATGAFHITESTATVFVLIPPAETRLGAQADDPNAPNYDPYVPSDIGFLSSDAISIPPILVSKYEFTLGQWIRATQFMPDLAASSAHLRGRPAPRRIEPVDSITAGMCDLLCLRLGMSLPTEVEWEYAARAGSTDRWWSGPTVESLLGCANVMDVNGKTRFPSLAHENIDDGFAEAAPVGKFRANRFGLHDMIGNLQEICSTSIQSADSSIYRIIRGGSFIQLAERASSAFRNKTQETNATLNTGFRPVMHLPIPK